MCSLAVRAGFAADVVVKLEDAVQAGGVAAGAALDEGGLEQGVHMSLRSLAVRCEENVSEGSDSCLPKRRIVIRTASSSRAAAQRWRRWRH